MRIAVDAAGGDFGIKPNVEGAALAVKKLGHSVALVGPEGPIRAELAALGAGGDKRLSIVDAPELIDMKEEPVAACREKQKASIMLACELAARQEADAVVSAGHSGATMVAALWHMKRLKGVLRPAIAAPIPTLKGTSVLLDAGANVECKPWHLLQFALMGSVYARHVLRIQEPSVGILSIGEEESKGNELVRETMPLLKASGIRFHGPVEGRDIPAGTADVVVCDGFTGNVCLKLMEGTASAMMKMLKSEIESGLVSKAGGLLIRGAGRRLKARLDYQEYGGAPLLGVDGTAIICHGKSTPRAIFNAVRVAADLAGAGAKDQIRDSLERVKANMELARAIE